MNRLRNLATVAAAVMIFITAAVLLPRCIDQEDPEQGTSLVQGTTLVQETTLVLSDPQTGEIYASYPIENGDTFGVEFIHSVNKSPVRDIYQCRDGEIWNIQCIYYGFGAGVEEILLEGETLTYGDNGEMIVSNIDRKLDQMILVVGTISDHTLYLGDETVSLRDLCGRSSKVLFTCQQG